MRKICDGQCTQLWEISLNKMTSLSFITWHNGMITRCKNRVSVQNRQIEAIWPCLRHIMVQHHLEMADQAREEKIAAARKKAGYYFSTFFNHPNSSRPSCSSLHT